MLPSSQTLGPAGTGFPSAHRRRNSSWGRRWGHEVDSGLGQSREDGGGPPGAAGVGEAVRTRGRRSGPPDSAEGPPLPRLRGASMRPAGGRGACRRLREAQVTPRRAQAAAPSGGLMLGRPPRGRLALPSHCRGRTDLLWAAGVLVPQRPPAPAHRSARLQATHRHPRALLWPRAGGSLAGA